ncbi:MAG: hypothetical protein HFF49_14005 [Lawsonibacter sp.]|jgi:hypothetical protein|nr:hypothetical protein [Lawsonibacter sp.]
MDILLAPILGGVGVGFVLFFIQTILVLLPHRRPARVFPLVVLVLWVGAMAWGIHNNPCGYILILFPGCPLALFGMLGLHLGCRCGRFCAAHRR